MELISDFGLSSNDFRLLLILLLPDDFFDVFDLDFLFSDVEDVHDIVLDESLRGAFLRELFFYDEVWIQTSHCQIVRMAR